MIIAPLVFSTLVVGIAKMGDIATVGRVGGKALGWFIFASLISLTLGLILVQTVRARQGHAAADPRRRRRAPACRPTRCRSRASSSTLSRPASSTRWRATRSCRSWCSRCSSAWRWRRSASAAASVVEVLDAVAHIMLKVTGYVMMFAPLAVFGALASTVAKEGLEHHRRLRPVHRRVLSRPARCCGAC